MIDDRALVASIGDGAAPDRALDLPPGGSLVAVTEGAWTGWHVWRPVEPFETVTGPFYTRIDGSRVECGFQPGWRNTNGFGNVQGGALLTFADYALFRIPAGLDSDFHGVTVSLGGDFLRPASLSAPLLAHGEVTRAGRSLVFVRGLISQEGQPVLSFDGIVKKVEWHGPAHA